MKLAEIATVHSIKPIEGRDRIEAAMVHGWSTVVPKGQYEDGETIVFVPIDTVIERAAWNEFLFKDKNATKYRVKTVRMGGVPSQGVVFPLSITNGNHLVGEDVSSFIGVTKYEKEIPANIRGLARGHLPAWLRKSDEDNLKSNPACFNELKQVEVVITLKMDGSSTKFYLKDKEFGVCSRSLDLKETEDNVFWQAARKHNIESGMRANKYDELCLCGEVCGPKLNGNALGLTELQFYLYDIWDIATQKYVGDISFFNLPRICPPQPEDFTFKTVPELYRGPLKWNSIEEIQEWVNTLKYDNGAPAEGVVIRPVNETYSETLNGRLSVKLINQNYKD